MNQSLPARYPGGVCNQYTVHTDERMLGTWVLQPTSHHRGSSLLAIETLNSQEERVFVRR